MGFPYSTSEIDMGMLQEGYDELEGFEKRLCRHDDKYAFRSS